MAEVPPINKKGDKRSVENYPQVTLLYVRSEVSENLCISYMSGLLNCSKQSQHVFVMNRSALSGM